MGGATVTGTRTGSARGRIAVAAAALILAGVFASNFAALGQDGGLPPPKDTIFARKILMGAIDMNMDEIETMLAPGGKVEVADAVEHADTISIMLMSFPHLFPAATNQWKPNVDKDPGTDTFAAPEVWTQYADFYKRSTEASKLAFDASRATEEADFRAAVKKLRAACDACHAVYMRTN